MPEIQSKKWKATQAAGCLSVALGIVSLLFLIADIDGKFNWVPTVLILGGIGVYVFGWTGSWWNHG